jgi:hypothetical protein
MCRKVATEPAATRCALTGFADRLGRIGVEASSLGMWLRRELHSAGPLSSTSSNSASSCFFALLKPLKRVLPLGREQPIFLFLTRGMALLASSIASVRKT